MTQEDKELLLKDLCARVFYEVKISAKHKEKGKLIGTLNAVYPDEERVILDNLDKAIAYCNVRTGGFRIEEHEVKPYLRPLSSMTEEEKKEFESLGWRVDELDGNVPWNHNAYNVFEGVDWLNSHHFDYHGLIEKNLALEAPETMYKRFGDMTVDVSVEYKGTKY